MNKAQYLAELGQLLVFMTRADREKTLARFGALFDMAGPDREQTLLAKIGSPTRSAIRLSRVYDSSHFSDEFMDSLEAEFAPIPEEPEPEPKKETPPDMVEGMPELDIPPLVMDDLSAFEPIPPEPEAAEAPAEGPSPSAPGDGNQKPQPQPQDGGEKQPPVPATPPAQMAPLPRPIAIPSEPDEEDDPERGSASVERVIPLWLGIPLFVLSLVLLALPLAVILLVILPVLLMPGLVLLLCTWLAAVGGLWCISYIADALMLFGAAFLIFGLALVVLWCGLRLDVALVTVYIRACRAVTHLTLGRKVTPDA